MMQKELLLLSIGVFLTIIAWMINDIYTVQKAKEYPSVSRVTVNVGSFDENVFEDLLKKNP